jgi:transcriptional regulator with XRE-family HTH domain
MKTFGANIRKRRKERDFSVKDLAERVEVSPSFVSQVESGKISPSLSKLKIIADALNTTVSRLIGDDSQNEGTPNFSVIRKNERKHVTNLGEGIHVQLLSTLDPYMQMEPLLFTLKPGATSGEQQYQHFGQEFVFVLGGACEIRLKDKVFVLKEGDSMYFNSYTPHSFRNIYEGQTELMWMVTPPSF